jgi:hypothetical protein
MPNKARKEVERDKLLIRKLMDVDNLKPDVIIHQLQITPRTFSRYLKRIQKEDVKLHEQQNKDSVRYREAKFHKTLEDGYLIAKRISEDRDVSPRDRLEAIKVMATCQAQMAKLSKYGLTFQPALPDQKVMAIEARESTV